MRWLVAITVLTSLSAPAAHSAVSTQAIRSGAVFAMIDSNEWCPGGSVYVDLRTGSFMLYPRVPRPACKERKIGPAVERGTLSTAALKRLWASSDRAIRAGLRRQSCAFIVSNGGPQTLTITAPQFSESTPDELGCWSEEATTLHRQLFELFGAKR